MISMYGSDEDQFGQDMNNSMNSNNNNNITQQANTSQEQNFGNFNETTSKFSPIEMEQGPIIQQQVPSSSSSSSPTVNMGSNVNNQFTWWDSITSCFNVETYRKNFDVNTIDIQQRLVGSLLYFNIQNGFNDRLLKEKGPDGYAPFWVTMTLVFFVAFTSNVNAYLKLSSKTFEYDVGHIIRAMVVLFSFSYGLPTLLYIILRCTSAPVALMHIITLYGYCLVAYLPVTILCMIPDDVVVWLVLALATAISLIFILRNLSGLILSQTTQEKGGPVFIFIICCHVILFLILKIGFYHHVEKL